MKYNDLIRILSQARLTKYETACDGDKAKTILLYQNNIKLSQRFYGVIGVFEVMLRNAIYQHYAVQYKDTDWLVHQYQKGQILEQEINDIKKFENEYRNHGIYSADKMVASFSFGFWTYFFTKRNYRIGNKTLLQIFQNKKKGLMQRDIYSDLNKIREFRNRIAHHEPICFDKNRKISTIYCREIFNLICNYITYMGEDYNSVLRMVEKPDSILRRIDSIH